MIQLRIHDREGRGDCHRRVARFSKWKGSGGIFPSGIGAAPYPVILPDRFSTDRSREPIFHPEELLNTEIHLAPTRIEVLDGFSASAIVFINLR